MSSRPDRDRAPGLLHRPLPPQTQDTAFFWEQASRHKLAIQRCCGCKALRHPPMPVCPHCHGLTWDFVESAGTGTLFSYTTVHAPLVPPFDQPYSAGIVELDEGTRLVAQLEDRREGWRIGMRVQVRFADCEGGFSLPYIKPSESA